MTDAKGGISPGFQTTPDDPRSMWLSTCDTLLQGAKRAQEAGDHQAAIELALGAQRCLQVIKALRESSHD